MIQFFFVLIRERNRYFKKEYKKLMFPKLQNKIDGKRKIDEICVMRFCVCVFIHMEIILIISISIAIAQKLIIQTAIP